MSRVFPNTLFLIVALSVLRVDALVPRRPLSPLNVFALRQATDCTTECSAFDDFVTTCTGSASSTTCLCTSQVASTLQSCVTCSVNESPTPGVISTAEDLVNSYLSVCSGEVVSVPGVAAPSSVANSATSPTATLTATSSAQAPITPTTSSAIISSFTETLSGTTFVVTVASDPQASPTSTTPIASAAIPSISQITIRPGDLTSTSAQTTPTASSAVGTKNHSLLSSRNLGVVSLAVWLGAIMMF
ncbi:hypothetical protein HYPSUDRAFT_47052 [Hypholoma sublateritium FD-334 SS-4]|uniref:Extracellular membrane protein CFEM domain-containing protein n=1 Tax=Hypholoma sublateritium (strain FD-334 SS-4) TaxID=945553 RepID=A0A0D2KQ93_HYPSF|nr:hypothetical protein HYPSUDRAFT_47052 [Hypholoma sublateritium FD-334 SS-4]